MLSKDQIFFKFWKIYSSFKEVVWQTAALHFFSFTLGEQRPVLSTVSLIHACRDMYMFNTCLQIYVNHMFCIIIWLTYVYEPMFTICWTYVNIFKCVSTFLDIGVNLINSWNKKKVHLSTPHNISLIGLLPKLKKKIL